MPSPSTHLRAPLLWLLLPLMAGLTAARLWLPPATVGLLPLAITAALFGMIAIWHACRPGRGSVFGWGLSLVVSGGLGGFVLLHFRQPHLHETLDRPPREVTVTLLVQQTYPAARQARSLTGLGEITATGEHDRELIGRRVYFSVIRRISLPPLRSGRYVVRGVIEALPREATEVSFNDYLDNLGIRQKLTRAQVLREVAPPGRGQRFCSRTMDRFEQILRHGLEQHPTVSSLYLAMLLGEKAVLSEEQQNAFMRSGTFHIFSISGLHVGVIAGAIYSALNLLRVPRRTAVVLSLLILWIYVQVTGASSPAMRSWLMIAFLLIMQVSRLPGNGLAALSAAALVTLLLDPMQLFSTGFQMSYAVVLALIVMGVPLAEKWLARWRPFSWLPKPNWRWYHTAFNWSSRWLVGASAACWAAFLASTPSGIGYFQLLSPGSLLANLVIIPLSSLAIVSGFLALLTGLIGLLSLSALFNSAAAIIIIVMDWLAQRGTHWPGVYFNARFTHSWLAPVSLVALTAVLLACLSGRWSRRYGGFWPPVALIAVLLVFGVKFG